MGIENKLDEIQSNMLNQLRTSKAIDSQDVVINTEKFIKIVEQSIKEANDLFPLVENEAGVTIDRNGANVLSARLDFFNDMLRTKSLSPAIVDTNAVFKAQEGKQKQFKFGTFSILKKIKQKFSEINSKSKEK